MTGILYSHLQPTQPCVVFPTESQTVWAKAGNTLPSLWNVCILVASGLTEANLHTLSNTLHLKWFQNQINTQSYKEPTYNESFFHMILDHFYWLGVFSLRKSVETELKVMGTSLFCMYDRFQKCFFSLHTSARPFFINEEIYFLIIIGRSASDGYAKAWVTPLPAATMMQKGCLTSKFLKLFISHMHSYSASQRISST